MRHEQQRDNSFTDSIYQKMVDGKGSVPAFDDGMHIDTGTLTRCIPENTGSGAPSKYTVDQNLQLSDIP